MIAYIEMANDNQLLLIYKYVENITQSNLNKFKKLQLGTNFMISQIFTLKM